jgi:tetratricopeptide (TPR) repeat protein
MVATISKSMVFTKVNADSNKSLREKYGVAGFPTIVVTRPNGREIDRMVGYYPPENFIPTLVDLLTNRNTLDYLLKKSAENPDSLELLNEIAENYTYRSDFKQANYYYSMVLENDKDNSLGLADDAWMSLAGIKRREDKTEEAVEMYAQLEEKFPESDLVETSKLMIPYTYYRADDLKNAEKHFKKFKKEFPDSEQIEWVDKQLEKIKEEKKK